MENNRSPKQELEHILATTDIAHIEQIQFFPTHGEMFSSKNENIMKLAVYISKSLGKKSFTAGELKNAFEFIITNLDSHLPREEYNQTAGAIQAFITSGGSIEVLEKEPIGVEMISIDLESKEEKEAEKKPATSALGGWDELKTFSESPTSTPVSHTSPIITPPSNPPFTHPQGKEKIMTWKNVLMGMFVLGPISGIIGSLIAYPLRLIYSYIGGQAIFNILIGLISFIISPFVFMLLSERILHLSRKGSIILFFITSLIGIGIFAAVCGGILFGIYR